MTTKELILCFDDYVEAPRKSNKKGIKEPLSVFDFYLFLKHKEIYSKSWSKFSQMLSADKFATLELMDYINSAIKNDQLKNGLLRNYSEGLVSKLLFDNEALNQGVKVAISIEGINNDDLKSEG